MNFYAARMQQKIINATTELQILRFNSEKETLPMTTEKEVPDMRTPEKTMAFLQGTDDTIAKLKVLAHSAAKILSQGGGAEFTQEDMDDCRVTVEDYEILTNQRETARAILKYFGSAAAKTQARITTSYAQEFRHLATLDAWGLKEYADAHTIDDPLVIELISCLFTLAIRRG